MLSRSNLFVTLACAASAGACSDLIGADFDGRHLRSSNQAPLAQDAVLENVVEGTTGNTLQLSASDPENDTLTYHKAEPQPRGRASIAENTGLLTYESDFGSWAGGVEDVVGYRVDDGRPSAEAKVKVSLLPAGPRQLDPGSHAPSWSPTFYGASVDFDDDRAIVGATYDGAYILHRGAAGIWETKAKISPPDEDALNSAFGIKAALSGNWVIVGAYGFWDARISPPGKVYFFKWTGEEYTLVQVECAVQNNCAAGPRADRFGMDLALDGGVAAIAARDDPADDGLGNLKFSAGAVYVYELDQSGERWQRKAKLRAPAPAEGDQFGASIALDGQTLAVGAPGTDTSSSDAGQDSGAVYVFEDASWRRGATATTVMLPGLSSLKNYRMGQVALSGNRLLLGVPEAVENPRNPDDKDKKGIAFLYERDDDDVWQVAPHAWKPPDSPGASELVDARFGTAVAIDGDIAVVTRRGSNDNGAAFIFRREIQPGPVVEWILRRTHVNKRVTSFGWSAAVAGMAVLVGAPHGGHGEVQAFHVPREPGVAFLCTDLYFTSEVCAQSTIARRSPGQLFLR